MNVIVRMSDCSEPLNDFYTTLYLTYKSRTQLKFNNCQRKEKAIIFSLVVAGKIGTGEVE